MTERVGNRVIPIVSVVTVIVIMVIINLTWSAEASSSGPPVPTIEVGQRVYAIVCANCHDPDPTVDRLGGTYGPPIAGSSRELLRLRVLGTEYPDGYTPKRDTNLMTSFPLGSNQIESLYVFLQNPSGTPRSGPTWLIPLALVGGLLLLMLFRRRVDLPPRRTASYAAS